MTADSVERRLHGVAIYNPDLLSKRELVAQFVARQELLDQIVADLHRPGFNQHQIIVGTRGMGKTTLLRRIRYAIEDDATLAAVWFPLTFPEEQYNVARLSDLYLNFIDALGDALEQSGRREEAAALDDAVEALPRGDEARRASAALDLLLGMAKQMDRRLVLLVDNLDLVLERLEDQEGAQWSFRELLSQEPRLLLIGAMPVVIGATYDYGAPFYDFFRIHELRGLTRAETRVVLARLAQEQNAPEVERLLEHDPARIDTLHTLTGGNPRTVALLFGVLARGTDGDVRSDLEKLLDQCTPLYKARFESLSPQAQQVVDAVAIHWDPISAGELTDKLPMEVNAISAQLNRLVQQGVIEKVEYHPASKTGFQVAERFFNIWYLMRASRRVRRRLIWLVQFLRLFYGADQVKTKARDLLQNALRGSSDEKLRHAEFCLAVAQLIADDRSMRFELESHAIRTLLTDTALTEQITTMLDLDGEDVSLRGVVDREKWREEFSRAIEDSGLDAKEKERARNTIAAAPVPRHARLAMAQHLREHSKKQRARFYDGLQETAAQLEEMYGPSFAAKLRRALADGFMDGLRDLSGAALASEILGYVELTIYPGTSVGPDQLLAIYSNVPQSHFVATVLARSLADTGRYEEARPLLNVLQSGERSGMADFTSGLVLQGLGLPEQAASSFERAVQCVLAPRGMWLALATVQAVLGRTDAAVASFEHVLAKKRDAAALTGYAHVLVGAGRYAQAERAAREALQQTPRYSLAEAALVLSLLAQDRREEALSVTESFGDLEPASLALARLAALVGTGRTEPALEELRRYVTRTNDPAQILSYVGLLFMLDAGDDALAHLRRALTQGAETVVANTSSVIDAFGSAVSNGHASRVLDILDELELQDVLRPVYEALRIVVSGERETLKRLAPEVQQATAALLERWQPQAVTEKKPRKKAVPKQRRRRLT